MHHTNAVCVGTLFSICIVVWARRKIFEVCSSVNGAQFIL